MCSSLGYFWDSSLSSSTGINAWCDIAVSAEKKQSRQSKQEGRVCLSHSWGPQRRKKSLEDNWEQIS